MIKCRIRLCDNALRKADDEARTAIARIEALIGGNDHEN